MDGWLVVTVNSQAMIGSARRSERAIHRNNSISDDRCRDVQSVTMQMWVGKVVRYINDHGVWR